MPLLAADLLDHSVHKLRHDCVRLAIELVRDDVFASAKA